VSTTEAPKHLSAASRAWWTATLREYALEDHHLLLLRAACESWDRAETARRRVAADGLFVEDRFGQLRPHPGADIERKARSEFRGFVRELGLDVAAPGEVRGPEAPANHHLRAVC
jgi:P27 family predicted phage terminase small subunit